MLQYLPDEYNVRPRYFIRGKVEDTKIDTQMRKGLPIEFNQFRNDIAGGVNAT